MNSVNEKVINACVSGVIFSIVDVIFSRDAIHPGTDKSTTTKPDCSKNLAHLMQITSAHVRLCSYLGCVPYESNMLRNIQRSPLKVSL